MTTIIRDSAGNVINIGAWDYGVIDVEDSKGRPTGEVRITNPLPAGAYEDEADIVTGWDGGLYVADDARRLGPTTT